MRALEQLRDLVSEPPPGGLPSLTEELVRTLDLDLADGVVVAIGDVVALTGVSADTLRYYEKAGLLKVGRDEGGRRAYDRDAIGRVVFITRLRASDMSIRDIERYVRLVEAGEGTIDERLRLLETHRAEIVRRLDDLHWALAVIDYKITTYGGRCA